ncbi:MAG: DNA polymerase III subunit gamma/tau [Candidatus Aminicenantia bacterium]
MSYLVLARKYRPLTFDQVIGQKPVVQTLKNAILHNRVAHAYLFSGMRGVGKTTVARILAKALNCQSGPTPNPCNQCDSCISINEDRAVDVLEIDGASNRGIDEVRALREGVRYKPIQSRYRVVIIDEVHMLTTEAFNALLKTLEEPPSHTIFIFATTEYHKVPATILSRCQHFEFKKISQKEIIDHLNYIANQEKIKVSPFGMNLITQQSEGSLRDAQSLLDQAIAFSGEEVKDEDLKEILGLLDRQLLYSFSEAIIDEKPEKIFSLVEEIINSGYDLRYFYKELIQHFRNLLLVKSIKNPIEIFELNREELDQLKKEASKIEEEDIFRYLTTLQQAEPGLKYSSHPRIYLETVLLRLIHLKKLVPLKTIIQELEKLKEEVKIFPKIESEGESEKLQIPSEEVDAIEERREDFSPINQETELEKEKGSSFAEHEQLTEKEIYKKFLEKIRLQKSYLAAILDQHSSFRIKDNKLQIGFSSAKKFFSEKVKKEAKLLEKIVSELIGREIEVEVIEQFIEEEINEKIDKEYELALKDPTVKYFMDLFKAQIISVEPIKKE